MDAQNQKSNNTNKKIGKKINNDIYLVRDDRSTTASSMEHESKTEKVNDKHLLLKSAGANEEAAKGDGVRVNADLREKHRQFMKELIAKRDMIKEAICRQQAALADNKPMRTVMKRTMLNKAAKLSKVDEAKAFVPKLTICESSLEEFKQTDIEYLKQTKNEREALDNSSLFSPTEKIHLKCNDYVPVLIDTLLIKKLIRLDRSAGKKLIFKVFRQILNDTKLIDINMEANNSSLSNVEMNENQTVNTENNNEPDENEDENFVARVVTKENKTKKLSLKKFLIEQIYNLLESRLMRHKQRPAELLYYLFVKESEQEKERMLINKDIGEDLKRLKNKIRQFNDARKTTEKLYQMRIQHLKQQGSNMNLDTGKKKTKKGKKKTKIGKDSTGAVDVSKNCDVITNNDDNDDDDDVSKQNVVKLSDTSDNSVQPNENGSNTETNNDNANENLADKPAEPEEAQKVSNKQDRNKQIKDERSKKNGRNALANKLLKMKKKIKNLNEDDKQSVVNEYLSKQLKNLN